jgi:hypothetical protein
LIILKVQKKTEMQSPGGLKIDAQKSDKHLQPSSQGKRRQHQSHKPVKLGKEPSPTGHNKKNKK